MLGMSKASCPQAGVLATGVAVVLYLIVTTLFYVYYEEKPCESASRLSAADYDADSCKEDWTVVDALYFTMVSMSTVGYGDLSPSDSVSKVLTMAFVLVGVAVVFCQTSQVLAAASDDCERRVIHFFVMMADKRARDKMFMTGRGASVGHLGQLVDLDGDGVADVVEPPGALVFWTQHYAFNVVVFVALQLISSAVFTEVQPDMNFGDALYLCVVTSTTVGYGDIPITTQNARLFSFFHILLSVSWLGAAITQLEPLRGVRRQQLQRMELLKRKLDTELITSLDRDGGGRHPATPRTLRPRAPLTHALHCTHSPPRMHQASFSSSTLRASPATAGNGVNQTEFVVGMLCALGAEMCGEPLVWEDVLPFIRQFQSLDADQSGILSKADLQLIAERQREKLSDKNTKLVSKLEKHGQRRSQSTLLTPRGSIGGGSTATTPRGSVSRVSPADEDAPATSPKLAGSSAPATAPCCDRAVPVATKPPAVVTPA